MERSDDFDDPTADEPEDDDALGEDHRGDEPGYDLDEQSAIEELEQERKDE